MNYIISSIPLSILQLSTVFNNNCLACLTGLTTYCFNCTDNIHRFFISNMSEYRSAACPNTAQDIAHRRRSQDC